MCNNSTWDLINSTSGFAILYELQDVNIDANFSSAIKALLQCEHLDCQLYAIFYSSIALNYFKLISYGNRNRQSFAKYVCNCSSQSLVILYTNCQLSTIKLPLEC